MRLTFTISAANIINQMEKMAVLEDIVKDFGDGKTLEDVIKTNTSITVSNSIGGSIKIAYNYKDYLDGVKVYFIFGFYVDGILLLTFTRMHHIYMMIQILNGIECILESIWLQLNLIKRNVMG